MAPSDGVAAYQPDTDRVPDGAVSTTKTDGLAGTPTSTAASAYASYRRRTAWRVAMLLRLATLLLAVFLVVLMVGPLGFSPTQVLGALFDADYDPWVADIVINLRLPPALLAVLVDGALSLAGVRMQTILDNPLTEPFTLGISTTSALGAALAIITGLALPMTTGATLSIMMMTAGLAASLTIAMASRLPSVTKEMTILLGIALVSGCQALLALVQYWAFAGSLQQIVFWSMGSLIRATWPAVAAVSAALLVATPVFRVNSWRLTAITLGEAHATAMGINVARLRAWTLVGVSLLVALSVAFVGIIGFVGFVGPHMARGLVEEDQRFLVSVSILHGAILLTAAHTANQLIVPGVAVPVGILTALVGVPVFLTIVFGHQRSAVRSDS